MASKHLGGDFNFAWPSANVAVMGIDAAVEILYAKTLASVEDADSRNELFLRLREEYTANYCSLDSMVDDGFLDEIIRPEDTRFKVISALNCIADKTERTPWKKHDNLPL
jgi:acetyl-CoA carboxylase carboxyltransferase component